MKKYKDGFTLVEIIVVLLIIGILLAITIPSIIGYVSKAHDAELLTEARSVLLASKTKGAKLYANDEIMRIEHDPTIATDIISESEIDGEFMEIEVNKALNNAGDFILKLGDKYVYYTDQTQHFEVSDELVNTMNFVKRLNKKLAELAHAKLLKNGMSIYEYLTSKSSTLDSEGPNFGLVLKNELQKLGFNPNTYSMVLCKDNNKFYILVTEKKLTLNDAGSNVKVTKFAYPDKSFAGEASISYGTVDVSKSSVETVDDPSKDKDFPVLNVNTFQ